MDMFLRFLLIVSFVFSANANAEFITSDDVKIKVTPFNEQSLDSGNFVNNLFIELKLPEGWYTYYKNGGDSGLGAKIQFSKIPENIIPQELDYQAPEKHIENSFVSYIYQNNATFSLNLLRKDTTDNKQDKSLNLKGKLNFLVCNNICIPLEKDFSITTPFTDSIVSKSKNIDFAKTFPTLATKQATFTIKDNFIYILLDDSINKATFIPNEDGIIDDTSNQEIIELNNNIFLKIALDEYFDKNSNTISGLLETNIKNKQIEAIYKNIELNTPTEKIAKILLVALFALIGGIILNLMPCVLPVIGLKVFSLLNHKSKAERIKGALIYSSGVFVSMMLIVGVLLILKSLGENIAWGFQLQNAYFIYFMIGLLMLVGLNLLGFISIGDKLANKASRINMKHSGDFFTGILTTFVATPCTAPFMASSLGFALASNSMIITFTIFTFLALGIALPIILIAFIPKLHKLLPKPGLWSEKLKEFLAFPIFATIVWLIWVLDIDENGTSTLIVFSIFILVFILWLITLKSKIKYILIALLVCLSTFGVYANNKEERSINKFNKAEVERLNNHGTTVFVDFTAKWCLTCQYNKKTVLDTLEVKEFLKENNIVFMIADWTNKDSAITNELKRLERSGVPVYAIYPAYNTNSPILLPELLTTQIVLDSIKELN